MLSSSIPAKFGLYWGYAAGVGYIRDIPEASQIGLQTGAASLTDGFVPANFLPVGAGGTPPFGKDMNGILRQITQWCQWQSAGGPITFDADFASKVGGYPKGAIILSATLDRLWLNQADSNSVDPDVTGTNWVGFDLSGIATTGDIKWRPTDEIIPGWVKANQLTIGSATSNATGLASATAYRAFVWHWTNFSNIQCQVVTSGGVPTTRGVSADADWIAGKAIQTIDLRGSAPLGADTMGGAASTRLSGVPVTLGSATIAGSVLGENLHVLTTAEIAAHIHTGTTDYGGVDHTHPSNYFIPQYATGGGAGLAYTGINGAINTGPASAYLHVHTFTTGSAGGGGGHNTVARSMLGSWYIKL